MTRTDELLWGRQYVMVEPTHFRVAYAINPYMDPWVRAVIATPG